MLQDVHVSYATRIDGCCDFALTCSAMAVNASRTLANVKSSAITPRQPEVPNLMGEVVLNPALVLMAGLF